MFSSCKFNSFFALVLILPIFFLNSCGIERSEYGKKSDYQKLGYTCPGFIDISPPTATSEIPTDNTTYNSVDTTVSVTFSEALATSSITTNTSDTTCSGSFQLSSDNFSTCIKMSADPVASNDNKTFTVTPASSLSADTTFKRRLTSPIADTS
ncbi:MAG: Ig-like domain-containing protein, partial [SAR324 cluster bacterium]|nr:Ig-like domain-containing protein [SAR324 cluster bacterium]